MDVLDPTRLSFKALGYGRPVTALAGLRAAGDQLARLAAALRASEAKTARLVAGLAHANRQLERWPR